MLHNQAEFELSAPLVEKRKWRCLSVPGFMPAKKVPLPIIPPAKGERTIVAVDSFAGGGGASNGIKKAFKRLFDAGLLPIGHPFGPTYAINHDEAALAVRLHVDDPRHHARGEVLISTRSLQKHLELRLRVARLAVHLFELAAGAHAHISAADHSI